MLSRSFNTELINKIAQDFSKATGLAVVVVNVQGEEISELFNFTLFCQRMRQNPINLLRCRLSDRCGGLEASKLNEPCIYRCHAGLIDFSIPLEISGHLVGFVLCGQVRLCHDSANSSEININQVMSVDNDWTNDPLLVDAFNRVPVIDLARVTASAELLKIIVNGYLSSHLNIVVIEEENQPSTNEMKKSTSQVVVDNRIKKALRYIDSHLSEELKLEDVADKVYLSPYYFSKLFKKHQGIGFNAWVNQQRMVNAKEMLQYSDWSIATIAKNLGFAQSSYFCKVFRQSYNVTPQVFRAQNQ